MQNSRHEQFTRKNRKSEEHRAITRHKRDYPILVRFSRLTYVSQRELVRQDAMNCQILAFMYDVLADSYTVPCTPVGYAALKIQQNRCFLYGESYGNAPFLNLRYPFFRSVRTDG